MRIANLLILLCFIVAPAAVAAPKTDVVILANGDHITGEVKGLEHGQLRFKTDAAGTLSIEWDKVARLQSTQFLQVELENGLRYYGPAPAATTDGRLVLAPGREREGADLAMANVVRIDPIERGDLWARLDGYVTAGYDYTKSNDLQTFSFTGGLSSRTQRREWSIDGSAQITSQHDNPDSSRWQVTGNGRRFLANRYFYEGFAGLEANDELGLDLRTLLGAVYGRYLAQSNHQEWGVYAGLAYNHEDYALTGTQQSLEGVLGMQYDYFRFDAPEASLDASLNLFPSLTEAGRLRAEGKVRSRYELVKDLFFELSLYGSYDSDPGETAKSNSDYGLTTSLGYTF